MWELAKPTSNQLSTAGQHLFPSFKVKPWPPSREHTPKVNQIRPGPDWLLIGPEPESGSGGRAWERSRYIERMSQNTDWYNETQKENTEEGVWRQKIRENMELMSRGSAPQPTLSEDPRTLCSSCHGDLETDYIASVYKSTLRSSLHYSNTL